MLVLEYYFTTPIREEVAQCQGKLAQLPQVEEAGGSFESIMQSVVDELNEKCSSEGEFYSDEYGLIHRKKGTHEECVKWMCEFSGQFNKFLENIHSLISIQPDGGSLLSELQRSALQEVYADLIKESEDVETA